jgi:amino-acid N-acetyltransferase
VSGSPARVEEQGGPPAPRSAATHSAPRAPRTPGAAGAVRAPLPAAAVRGAVLADVPQLEALMAPYVATGDLLPRSNYDLCRHIKEYVVAEAAGGEIVGCGSLKIYSRTLGEVAGLAVRSDWQSGGVGLSEVLALTRKPAFFLRLGFMPAEREQFPLKVWADCARCPRQNCCDEIAVVRTL